MNSGIPYPKDKQLHPTKPAKAPTPPPTKVPKRRRYLSRAERAAYTTATNAARCEAGYLRCQKCRIPLLDYQAQRHHIIFRSHGGPTIAENLLLVCPRCHDDIHAHRGAA